MLTLTCIQWHKYHLNNQSNKIHFIVHIPIHHKILITPQIIVHKSQSYYTTSSYYTTYNPSETTGLFHLHHLVQPLHPHLHVVLPPPSSPYQLHSVQHWNSNPCVPMTQAPSKTFHQVSHPPTTLVSIFGTPCLDPARLPPAPCPYPATLTKAS